MKGLADRLNEAAEQSLGQERQTNTHRRAGMAASAEASARADQAKAETIKRIADAIGEGKATHLNGVRAGTHVDTLDKVLRWSMHARNSAEKIPYQESEGRPPAKDDIAHARYPTPYMDKGDLLRMASKMRETPGAKRIGERLRKAAEKMSDEGGQYIDTSDVLGDLADVARSPRAYGLDESQGRMIRYKMDDFQRLQAMDIKSLPELRAALREYLPLKKPAAAEDPVKAKERALIGRKIDGFFPTPRPAIDDMIDRAEIGPGMKVLEPSAGKGDILDVIRERHPEAETHGIEHHGELADIGKAKGHDVERGDFLEHKSDGYDRIVMNPPFEKGQDVTHVRHAYDLLKPGGRMVAIMSEGPFFRDDGKSKEFRKWLAANGGEAEAMPDGSFLGSDAFRQTGVRTRMVTINKPETTTLAGEPDLFHHAHDVGGEARDSAGKWTSGAASPERRAAAAKRIGTAMGKYRDTGKSDIDLADSAPPKGVDLDAIAGKIHTYLISHPAGSMGVGQTTDKVYEAVKPGMPPEDFHKVIVALANDKKVRLGGWNKSAAEHPDPEHLFQYRDKMVGIVHPGDKPVTLAGEPDLFAHFNPDEPRKPKGDEHGGEWTTGGSPNSKPAPSHRERFRDLIEQAKAVRREAHEEAKGRSVQHHESVGQAMQGAKDAANQLAWDSDLGDFEPYNQIEESAMSLDNSESKSVMFEELWNLITYAREALEVAIPEYSDDEDDDDYVKPADRIDLADLKANRVHLKAIIAHAKAGRQAIREHAAARREMAAIRDGSWKQGDQTTLSTETIDLSLPPGDAERWKADLAEAHAEAIA